MLNIKQIIRFEGIYSISDCGKVFNQTKQLKTYFTRTGYECVKLTDRDGKKSHKTIHRLVAEHFIPNPLQKSEVNHIDGNKANNCISNLEWVTSSENKRHALQTGLKVYNNPTSGKKLGKTSKYHNVGWDKSRKRWYAAIRHQGVNIATKRFKTEQEAALYVNYLIDLHGLDRPKNSV